LNPGRRGGKQATNRLSYGAALGLHLVSVIVTQSYPKLKWLGNFSKTLQYLTKSFSDFLLILPTCGQAGLDRHGEAVKPSVIAFRSEHI
jgi:hypothetical protein